MAALVGLPFRPNPKTDEFGMGYSPRRGRPILFQIVSPGPKEETLFPVLLALHTNPGTIEERMAKTKTVVPTFGGFVEFVWPDELSTISASHSTGAFLSPDAGLANGNDWSLQSGNAGSRKRTMAWERQEDMLELFHNNGVIFDSAGLPAIRGRVMMFYDRGVYTGHFTTFEVDESDDKPWSFELTWEFRVEETKYNFPSTYLRTDDRTSK